jgi:manganese/zinc/iron transport system permease protein
MIQNRPGGGAKAGLESYIYGQAAGMIWEDVALIAGVSAVALLIVVALYKEFKVLGFDPSFASAQGWPTLALDLTSMGTLALITVIGLPAVGVLLMAAMLIIPAAAARFWTHRLGPMLILSGLLGGLIGTAGALLSADVLSNWLGFDLLAFGDRSKSLPTGPLIVLCGTAVFLFSVLFAPRRGVIARAASHLRLRLKTAQENLLRSLYELRELQAAPDARVPVERLLERRAWSPAGARWLLGQAAKKGLVDTTPEGLRLTERGLAQAARLVRVHRLWERFLMQGVNIDSDHVDRDADSIEHLLTPDIIQQLEAGQATPELPGSPHDLLTGQ